MAMFNVTGQIASISSVHQNRWRSMHNIIIADAQYCVQMLLSERRRLGHVGVTLTVLHPTEQPRAQNNRHAVKQ